MPLAVWGSKISKTNCLFCFLPASALYSLTFFLKNELFLSPSYLVDASCVDSQSIMQNPVKNKNTFLFFIFYFLFLKQRIIFLLKGSSIIRSIDSIYPSANWIEREFIEMFGIVCHSKVDNRNLLLDYSLNENPLLKEYPSVGLREVHYSILSESVVYSFSNHVEL